MQDLCPLCLQSGLKKKIRLLQINLQEAVWMCEEEKCMWPFGYEDFSFCQRLVGKTWSCYWDDNTPPRLKENVALSSKSSVMTTKDTLRESISSILDTNSSENSSSIENTVNSKCNNNDLHISTEVKQKENVEKENVINETFNLRLNDNSFQSNNDKLKAKNIKNEYVNSLNKHIKEETDVSIQNIKDRNNVKGISKIANIDTCNIKTENKTISTNNVHTNGVGHNLASSLNDNIQSTTNSADYKELPTEPSKNRQLLNETTAKPNLNVTMMKIDGLPPITLAFEMPVSTTASVTVTSNMQQSNCKKAVTEYVTKSNTLDAKNTLMKRNVTSGKQYEKFSFSAIKKKIEKNNSTDTSNTGNNSSDVKPNLATMKNVENNSVDNTKKSSSIETFHENRSIANYNTDSKQIIATTDGTCMSNQLKNFESNLPTQDVSNVQGTISDTTTNTGINIETVLTDFLTNDYSVSEDINEEWLNSLLN